MESFDMFLNGNFVALPAFQKAYGVRHNGEWVIPTKWQSALFQAGQCGAFIGVFLAGPITNRWGYRWTTIFALILMNATIFISFFVSLPYRMSIGSSLVDISSRPIPSLSWWSVKPWKVCHGDSSLQIPPPMPVRSSLLPFVVLARQLYR